MAKLSVIIPSRDERFLIPTIRDVFKNAAQEIEVVAVLDSNLWPEGWKEITDQYPNLHTIHNGTSIGMRGSINKGVASAISRGAKFIMKSDGHCAFSEGFDEVLKSACQSNWVVIPRRGRLDPENWTAAETHKPDIDYHYLSFPDDPDDWGGAGLNGKPWLERAVERAQYELDDEMSSQGSCWFMQADYFNQLELMDESSYGPFWNEFQEIGLKCWLSGGRVVVNKKAKYLHLHKGKTYGRGYHLPESWLQKGRTHANLWAFNEAWPKQTLPFSWLIEHFWPVPSWPDNWEEILYATRKPKTIAGFDAEAVVPTDSVDAADGIRAVQANSSGAQLIIYEADYGIPPEQWIDVREQLQSLVKDNSLDIIVNNSTLTPDSNPFRGKKKTLKVVYSIDGGERITRHVEEKDWLIIGPVEERQTISIPTVPVDIGAGLPTMDIQTTTSDPPRTAAALNDYLIRKFHISPQRLRGPMPIELRDFHRNDLAQLFAELGFKRGAEIGVAEGNYSEILMKANPTMELLCVDPWHAYSDNPQNKTKEKNEYAYNEAKRKLCQPDWHVKLIPLYSMEAVRDVKDGSLDMIYIDGAHSYNYVLMDIICWSAKVRSGGIIALDDYFFIDRKRWGAGVVEAVQSFTSAHQINPWFICDAHRSVDAFWVNP